MYILNNIPKYVLKETQMTNIFQRMVREKERAKCEKKKDSWLRCSESYGLDRRTKG